MSESNGYIDKNLLLAANKRRYATIDVPGLGVVRIRNLTERERSAYECGFLREDGSTDLSDAKIRLIIATVCNKDGLLIFTDNDREALEKIDGIITNAIAEASKKLSGITDDSFEALVKNLEGTAGGDSLTGSQENSDVST